ncbi:hypothetical protein BJ912DRAFT_962460 [Pholiota molesta]|nr:hypothetical protein BJ912DRAFT_962460 [Pholiota molesta]
MSAFNSRSSTLVDIQSSFAVHDNKDALAAIPDWTLCVHPQGWVYFYNPVLKAVTDQDIRQPEVLLHTEEICSQYPLSELSEQMEVHIHMTQMISLAIGSKGLFNLAISHIHCVASYDLDEVKGDNSCLLSPLRLNRCRRLYWNYLMNHSVHVPTPSRALEDASDTLTWFLTDNLISGLRSEVPFSKTECEELSRVVAELALPRNDKSIAKTTFLAWLLREICSYRDADKWGQLTQRESQVFRDQKRKPVHTISPSGPLVTFLTSFIVNFIFFGIPHAYQVQVKATVEYRGRLSNVEKTWRDYIERLVREYSDFLLISTVLLSATVAFLSVPNLPEGAQVAATISTLASLGSIIVGVFSIWKHQTSTKIADSFTYMHNVRHSVIGLYGHAILLSLPPALLVWAILLFTLSIVISVMHGVGQETAIWRKVSIWSVLAIFVVLLIIVCLALYTFSIIWKFQSRTARLWNRFTDILTRRNTTKFEPAEENV